MGKEEKKVVDYHRELKKRFSILIFKKLNRFDFTILNIFYYSKLPLNQKDLINKITKSRSITKSYISIRCNMLEQIELIKRAPLNSVWSGKAGTIIDKRCRFYNITEAGERMVEFNNEKTINREQMPTLREFTKDVDEESNKSQ